MACMGDMKSMCPPYMEAHGAFCSAGSCGIVVANVGICPTCFVPNIFSRLYPHLMSNTTATGVLC